MNVSPFPRLVRPAAEPLGLYFRAGRNDHNVLSHAISTGHKSFFGIVFDATRTKRHKELLELAERSRLECILDPCTHASATVGGYSNGHGALPWGLDRPHRIADFVGANQTRIAKSLADYTVDHGFTQLLAPTHLIQDADDPWFERDIVIFERVREQLARINAKRVGLIYPLTLSYAAFRDEDVRERIISMLEGLRAQSVWLRIDGLGSNSSPVALKNYLDAASDFHHLGVPVIGDQVGGLVGLSLLAFAAVGGMSTGITVGERFSSANWRRLSDSKSHMPHPRVYLPTLDMYLKPKDASALFEHSTKMRAHFGCTDAECCPRGTLDMVENPARHFLIQRMKQVSNLSQIPEQLRPRQFLERYVRPTTDQVLRLASYMRGDPILHNKVLKHRKRLDAMRIVLSKIVESSTRTSHSTLPATRTAREARP